MHARWSTLAAGGQKYPEGTALHQTALHARTEAVRLLLESKVDVNAANEAGKTVFFFVVRGAPDLWTTKPEAMMVCLERRYTAPSR